VFLKIHSVIQVGHQWIEEGQILQVLGGLACWSSSTVLFGYHDGQSIVSSAAAWLTDSEHGTETHLSSHREAVPKVSPCLPWSVAPLCCRSRGGTKCSTCLSCQSTKRSPWFHPAKWITHRL